MQIILVISEPVDQKNIIYLQLWIWPLLQIFISLMMAIFCIIITLDIVQLLLSL